MKYSGNFVVEPTELKSEHNKIYTEKSVKNAIKQFQIENNLESFSEAGRALLIKALSDFSNA